VEKCPEGARYKEIIEIKSDDHRTFTRQAAMVW
jgi:hypothetical protein